MCSIWDFILGLELHSRLEMGTLLLLTNGWWFRKVPEGAAPERF